MIRLFDENEINFNHNKNVLSPISCFVIEVANGMFEVEMEVARQTEIVKGQIIKAPTPRGEQLFRVYRIIKTLRGKKVYGKHIFYDLAKNFLIDVRPTNVSCFTALNYVLSNTEYDNDFTGTSDILTQNTSYFIRKNPIQAIMSEDNSILNRWGGNLVRDNYNINIKAKGFDRGYEIRVGKNLVGIEDDSDDSNVKTRLYPTVVLGDTDEVIPLPEKYVDSPLINNYLYPMISEVRVEITDEQKLLTRNEIYGIMRAYCNDLYNTYNVDKPIINYRIDFVELSKTEQYKDFAILEQLDLYDVVTCKVKELDIDIKAKMVKYKYDALKKRYDTIELGDFRPSTDYSSEGIVKNLQERIKASESAIEHATNVITGNKGGFVVQRRHADGTPYETLYMDTDDINTAKDVLRINKSGLGFSKTGYNGPFGTAMTIDGHIVADYMDTGVLSSILLRSSNYVANSKGSKINLADGTWDSKNFKLDTEGNITSTGGLLRSANYSFTSGVFSNAGSLINLSNGVFRTPNFAINSAGSAFFRGQLQAPTGDIAGCIINSGGLYKNNGSVGFGLWSTTAHNNIAFHAGATNANIGSAPIRFYHNGLAVLENLEINGGSVGSVTCKIHDSSNQYWTDLFGSGIQLRRIGYGSILSMNHTGMVAYGDNNGDYVQIHSTYITLKAANGTTTTISPGNSASLAEWKTNIEKEESLLETIIDTDVYSYNYKYELEKGIDKTKYGFVIGKGYKTPDKVISHSGDNIELYSAIAIAWGGIKELANTLKNLKERVLVLENG